MRFPKVMCAAGAALLALLFALNIRRALNQSITADEAFTYNHFVGGDQLIQHYDANNHVLYTLLAKASLAVFGLSEFTLRLPSLLGGLLYLYMVYRLSRYLFGESWLFLLSVASLSLNPFVLDFLSAARGYGLALAFFLWAFYETLRYIEHSRDPSMVQSGKRILHRAAVALALSLAANLTLAFAIAALVLVLLMVLAGDGALSGGRAAFTRQVSPVLRRLCLPALGLALALLAWPLRTVSRDSFYFGANTLRETLQGLMYHSFFHSQDATTQRLPYLLWDIAVWFIPAFFLFTVVICVVSGRNWVRRRSFYLLERQDRLVFLTGGTMLAALLSIVGAHYVFGVRYPLNRTSLFWVPLFTVTCVAAVAALETRRAAFVFVGLPCAAYLAISVVQFARQIDATYYNEWRYDAGTKRIVNLIRARHAGNPGKQVRLGISWIFEPSLNFYRQMYGLDWLQRLDRNGPNGEFDYYVLSKEDAGFVQRLKLTPIYVDAVSGAILAEPARRGVLQSAQ